MAKKGKSKVINKPKCFVIMPFSKVASKSKKYRNMGKRELDTVFGLFKSILGKKGYDVQKQAEGGDILKEIVYELDRADLVCADLTSLNPNVMYELGIRHGFTKKTILLTQDLSELPFDLKGYHCIEYGWVTDEDKRKLGKDIRNTLKKMDTDPNVKFGPVHSHLGTKRLAIEEEEKSATIRKLKGLGAEIYDLWDKIKDVHRVLARHHPDAFTEAEDSFHVDTTKLDLISENVIWKEAKAQWALTYPSIDLLMSTRYIPEKFDEFNDIQQFTICLGTFRLSMQVQDYSLKSFFQKRAALECLIQDIIVIINAVANDIFGVDLKLKSKTMQEPNDSSED